MNDPLEHNDFEKRLKKAAEDFLPNPSGKVWENINDELHPRRRTYFLGTAAAVLLLLAVGVYFLQRQYYGSPVKPSITQQTPPVIPPAPTPSAPSNINNRANQPVQSEALAGIETAKGSNNKENTAGNSITKNFQKENNLTASFYKKKSEKSNSRITGLFATNKKEYKEQTQVSKTGNQMADKYGLPWLKNLSDEFTTATQSSVGSLIESFPFEYSNYTSSVSIINSQAEESSIDRKKEKIDRKKLHKKPSFEIFYSPSMGYRTLTKGSSGNLTNNSSFIPVQPSSPSALSNLKQQPEGSWSAGGRIIFPIGKTWSLQSGLSFAEMNYRISAYGAYPVYIQNSSSYYAASPARSVSFLTLTALAAARPSVTYLHNSYMTTEIPLMINKQFGNPHGVTFNIGAGAGLSYLIHSSPVIYSPFSERYFTDKSYLRPFNGDFHIETSALIPLGFHMKLDIGPSFQYQILSSYKNYPAVKEHPYLIGLKTGLQWGR